MTNALTSELLIAVFAGAVAIATMRKHTPKAVELLLWVGLVWVCLLGVTGIHDTQARDMTVAAFWGITQVVTSVVGLAILGVEQWLIDNRFLLADWGVLIAGVDLLVLAFLTSRRNARGWQPQVRLRDWMEFPRLAEPRPVPVTVSATDEINRRFNVWAPVAAAAALTWTTLFLIWTGDVAVPVIGRRLRSVAHTAKGARRRVASGEVVEMADLSRRAADARSGVTTWFSDAGRNSETNWLGGFDATSPDARHGGTDTDGTKRDRRDQLAS